MVAISDVHDDLSRPETEDAGPQLDGGEDGGRKLQITLNADAAQAVRRMSADARVSYPEVVRRGLMLLDLLESLAPGEELVIRDKQSGTVERIRFRWDL